MHPLLVYQLARAKTDDGNVDIEALLAMVDAAYLEADQWRQRTDRAALLMCEEMEELNSELRHLAHHDTLTGLPNRVHLAERLQQALTVARQEGGRIAVHYLDLDHFKQVNDTLGHAVGDELLRVAADRLRAAIRDGDTLARLGGDEFAVIQTSVVTDSDAETLARRLISVLEPEIVLDGKPFRVGVSIGVALSDGVTAPTAQQMMKNADIALYQVKDGGRGGFRIYDASGLSSPAADEGNLRRAADRLAPA